jgi:hypothetical protein
VKTYAELTHVDRGDPCAEYPGQWIVYSGGEVAGTFTDSVAAIVSATHIVEARNDRVSVCWACSDDDPRVGQTWFTGFYTFGRFDQFGRWVS